MSRQVNWECLCQAICELLMWCWNCKKVSKFLTLTAFRHLNFSVIISLQLVGLNNAFDKISNVTFSGRFKLEKLMLKLSVFNRRLKLFFHYLRREEKYNQEKAGKKTSILCFKVACRVFCLIRRTTSRKVYVISLNDETIFWINFDAAQSNGIGKEKCFIIRWA